MPATMTFLVIHILRFVTRASSSTTFVGWAAFLVWESTQWSAIAAIRSSALVMIVSKTCGLSSMRLSIASKNGSECNYSSKCISRTDFRSGAATKCMITYLMNEQIEFLTIFSVALPSFSNTALCYLSSGVWDFLKWIVSSLKFVM